MVHDGSHSKDLAGGILVLDAIKWFSPQEGVNLMRKLRVKREYVQQAKYLIELRSCPISRENLRMFVGLETAPKLIFQFVEPTA